MHSGPSELYVVEEDGPWQHEQFNGLLVPSEQRVASYVRNEDHLTERLASREPAGMISRSIARWLLLAASIIPAAAAQSAPPVFPTVSSYTLARTRITLPADLHSDRNLLLLSFKPDQQPDVNSWNAAIDPWRGAAPSLAVYNCLVSPRSNMLSRWWQNSSLRSDLPDAKRWSTTVPLYVDKDGFRKTLDIASEKQVVVLLTDRQGHVLARATGAPTEQSLAAIRSGLPGANPPR